MRRALISAGLALAAAQAILRTLHPHSADIDQAANEMALMTLLLLLPGLMMYLPRGEKR